MPFQIDQDRAVVLTLSPGPIIDANYTNWRMALFRGITLQRSKNRVGAGLQPDMFRETGSGFTAQRIANQRQHLPRSFGESADRRTTFGMRSVKILRLHSGDRQ